jgi:2-oxoglutarate ferredoxin oxidoreductase subunit beta
LIAQLDGADYVARGAVNTAHNVAITKQMVTAAFSAQLAGRGFSFVEILTMCPTGWFVDTADAPEYLGDNLAAVHSIGVLKDGSRVA